MSIRAGVLHPLLDRPGVTGHTALAALLERVHPTAPAPPFPRDYGADLVSDEQARRLCDGIGSWPKAPNRFGCAVVASR